MGYRSKRTIAKAGTDVLYSIHS